MKKYTLLAFTVCWILKVSGQITIQRSDLPIINDAIRITNTNIANVNYTQTGADFIWDFSQLPGGNEEVLEYKAALQTDYRLFFLGLSYFGLKGGELTIGGYGLKDIYHFYEIDNNKYGIKGIGVKFQDTPLAAVYSKLDKIFSLPLKFNQKDSNEYAFKVEIPSLGAYKGNGVRVTEADGWGEITTPYGTFPCLRTKSVVKGTDSIFATILGFEIAFGLPVSTVEYQWWTKGQKAPVLSVEVRMVNNNFIPAKTYYRGTEMNKPTSIVSHQLLSPWKIYPINRSNVWRVEIPEENIGCEFKIYQLNGQLLQSQKLKALSEIIQIDAPSGLYIAVIQNNQGIASKKIVLQ